MRPPPISGSQPVRRGTPAYGTSPPPRPGDTPDAPQLFFALLLLGLVMRDAISSWTLDAFVPYVSAGGSFLTKIHPGSYLILLCGALAFPSVFRQTPKRGNPLFFGTMALVCACGLVIVQAALRGGGVIGFILDSMLVAPFGLIALARLSTRQLRIVGTTLLALVFINGLLSVVEVGLHRNILPFPYESEREFRPSGIFGHPLLTGLITTSTMPLVFVLVRNFGLKWLMVLTMAGFVATAQARFATVAAAGTLAILALMSVRTDLANRSVSPPAVMVGGLFALMTIPALVGILYATGRLDRLLGGFDDESTAARLNVYKIFDWMTTSQFYWGWDYDRALFLAKNFLDLMTFESPVVIYIILFGLFGAIMFLSVLYAFFISISIGTSKYIKLAVFLFLLVGSTNNVMASKGPSPMLFTALSFVAAIHYRDQLRRGPAGAPGPGAAPGLRQRFGFGGPLAGPAFGGRASFNRS